LSAALGQIVISRAGRDAGRRFVVVKVVDEFFVEISDGDLRRIEKPKKKKVKHLNITGERAESLEEKLKSGAKITNAEIRKALADLDF
jgi:large subunit ribosomal protein L14e